MDENAFNVSYKINQLVIKKPTGQSKPYGIFYMGYPLNELLTLMKLIDEKKLDETSITVDELTAIESLKTEALWEIAIESDRETSFE